MAEKTPTYKRGYTSQIHTHVLVQTLSSLCEVCCELQKHLLASTTLSFQIQPHLSPNPPPLTTLLLFGSKSPIIVVTGTSGMHPIAPTMHQHKLHFTHMAEPPPPLQLFPFHGFTSFFYFGSLFCSHPPVQQGLSP